MLRKVLLTEDSRIGASCDMEYSNGPGEIEIDFPEDFDFEYQPNWQYVNGELVYDPLPMPEAEADPVQKRLEALEAAICELALGDNVDGKWVRTIAAGIYGRGGPRGTEGKRVPSGHSGEAASDPQVGAFTRIGHGSARGDDKSEQGPSPRERSDEQDTGRRSRPDV